MKDHEPRLVTASRPLVVGTYNIRGWGREKDDKGNIQDGVNAWEYRKWLTIKAIRRMKADIVGLQEYSVEANDDFYRKNLPEYARHLGYPVGIGWSNPIFYNSKILTIKESRTIWLHPEDRPKPAWGSDEIRSANLVVFEYRPTSKREDPPTEIIFVNEHQAPDNPLAQMEGSKKIVKTLSLYSGHKVLVGDKNSRLSASYAETSSERSPYKVLFEDAGLREVFIETHPGITDPLPPTFVDFSDGQYDPGHIDGIMASDDFKAISCEIMDEDPEAEPPLQSSDHWAKRAELELIT